MVAPVPTTSDSHDGRTARRERNRVAVLDAVLELFAEGDLHPSPEAVAARSGVSLRSVYRYVVDHDELVAAAIERHHARVEHLFALTEAGRGPLAERIERLVAARMKLYETIAATHRAARRLAPNNALVAARLDAGRTALQLQAEQQFAAELRALPARERRHIAAAIGALTQIENLDYFRVQCRHSRRTTSDILSDALRRLLGAKEQ